jgi:hypothetical protein
MKIRGQSSGPIVIEHFAMIENRVPDSKVEDARVAAAAASLRFRKIRYTLGVDQHLH